MQIIRSVKRMQQLALEVRKQGRSISFVPTMGALHAGHISLVKRARKIGEVVVVSIFVNPTQFAPHEDLRRYPRNLKGDSELLEREGVDIIFYPRPQDVYQPGFDTYVVPDKISRILEGRFRPTHFRGVATVVLKLFNIVQPDIAVFGKKDLQQSVIIRQMVKDLNIPVQIMVSPTVRDRDGLALSSRNAYLNPEARKRALVISRALFEARRMALSGEKSAAKIRNYVHRQLVKVAGAEVDYVSIADEGSLRELSRVKGEVAISLACTIEGVRLIDNVTLRVK